MTLQPKNTSANLHGPIFQMNKISNKVSVKSGPTRTEILLRKEGNESKNESKRVRRTRKLMHLINRRSGKIQARAIKELESMFKASNLKIFIGEEAEEKLT